MKYTLASYNGTVLATVLHAGSDSLRDFCKENKIQCSGYRYTTALTTMNSTNNLIVILRDPHQRYDAGLQFLHTGNNAKDMFIEQHTAPYLEFFKDKKVRYIAYDKLSEYFPLDSDPEMIVPIKEYPEVYVNGELEQELGTYNHIIENNEELTVEEFRAIFGAGK